MEPEVYRLAREFRTRLLDGEEEARRQVLQSYQWAYQSINGQVEQLIRWLIEQGSPVTDAQLARLDRWQALTEQISNQLTRFGGDVQRIIAAAQRLQLGAARSQALEILRAARPLAQSFNALPSGALEQLVGFLQDGTPIAESLAKTFPGVVERVKQELVGGLASGKSLRQIARRVAATIEPPTGKRGQGTGPLAAALRTTRTEILRAHREASRETYNANADVLQGWIWLSSRGTHTCAACLAMDGTTHPLGSPMGSHPNCRCTMLPWLIGDPAPTDTGQAWLEKQSAKVQAEVLGRSAPDMEAAKAFRSGRVRLSDFVDERQSDVWGTRRTAKSLTQALASRSSAPPAPGETTKLSTPALDPLSEQLFGDRTKVEVTRALPDGLRETERNLFGRELTDLDYAELVGAPAGSRITVVRSGEENIDIEVFHPYYKKQERNINPSADGPFIYNSFWQVKEDAPSGLATRILARQVWYAQKMGIVQIDVNAYGAPGTPWNGYYTWPRLGFEAEFDAGDQSVIGLFFSKGIQTLQDLMEAPGGAEWWKESGWSKDATFDLREGSRSLTMHQRYLKSKKVVPYVDEG